MTVDCRHLNVFGWGVDRTGRFSLPQRSDEAAGCEIDGRGKAPMLFGFTWERSLPNTSEAARLLYRPE